MSSRQADVDKDSHECTMFGDTTMSSESESLNSSLEVSTTSADDTGRSERSVQLSRSERSYQLDHHRGSSVTYCLLFIALGYRISEDLESRMNSPPRHATKSSTELR